MVPKVQHKIHQESFRVVALGFFKLNEKIDSFFVEVETTFVCYTL